MKSLVIGSEDIEVKESTQIFGTNITSKRKVFQALIHTSKYQRLQWQTAATQASKTLEGNIRNIVYAKYYEEGGITFFGATSGITTS